MKHKLFFSLFLLVVASAAVSALTGQQILEESDKKLLPPHCSYRLDLDTVESDGTNKENLLVGYKKGNSKNVMIVRTPAKVSGSVHMRNQYVIWSYYVTDTNLVKEAYASTFMGSLLNYGDVMATELSYDYNVIRKRTRGKYYLLTLEPKPGHEGYAKVIVHVNRETMVPEKREYFALSGELMKTCDVTSLRRSNNKTTYVVQKYYEPLKDRYSTATYENIEYSSADSIPERYFDENYIPYLSGE